MGLSNYLMITGVTFLAQTPVSAGFYRGGSARLGAMLAFREP